ncbi:hypothetical protein W822_15060 [Advenella kashmirensis W13003]|uniref:DNA 3'-5' helicase n=1 Tax=Advenella kashmirensis W13003 TaxID=1424334 RepID=V8QSS9_9BURK|nr:UvrD-helicase domain-containing protein [Advenella kashmirensis]ETF02398.1 hypothetical protein W822_15060 [Advenella kashmirensis W13003]
MNTVNEARSGKREGEWLAQYSELFDTIESTPLTQEQRRACVSDSLATLVLAGAGTGKTSTLTGRVAFLVEHGFAAPENILCLAFAREAAREIQDRLHRRLGGRLALGGFTASTFHSLGLRIVEQVDNRRPALTKLSDDCASLYEFVQTQIQKLTSASTEYAQVLFDYFALIEPAVVLSCEYAHRDQYEEAIALRLIRTLRGESVKTPFDCLVANALSLMGMTYHYRRHYPQPVFIAKRRPYRSTFYLPDGDIYIDTFDCIAGGAGTSEAARHARLYARIHRHYGSRHIVLWEDAGYVKNIESLMGALQRKLVEFDVCVPSLTERHRAQRHREFIQILSSSDRWSLLMNELAGLLPLYRQRIRLEQGMSGACMQSDSSGVASAENFARLKVPMRTVHSRRQAIIMALLAPLAQAYSAHLQVRGEIDFDDMIARATEYVRQGRFAIPWQDILIDEFQDISSARFALIAAMIEQRPGLRLFCVGDDWQAIYRFAGSDIRYSTQFAERVHPKCRVVPLSRTFRFNQALCNVSSRFLMKNPSQNRKQLHAVRHEDGAVVSVVRQRSGLAVLLSRLHQSCWIAPSDNDEGESGLSLSNAASMAEPVHTCTNKARRSVLLLARFVHLLPDESLLQEYKRHYPALSIMSSTVHASKGLEADYVFILNMEQGPYGFPAAKVTDNVREAFLPESEQFEDADERRLFYVALTRARKHVWLLVPDEKAKRSAFVQELLRDNRSVVDASARFAIRRDYFLHRSPGDVPPCNITIGMLARCFDRWPVTKYLRDRVLAHVQKLTITGVIDKIQRNMVGLDIGTEEKNRIS